MTTYTLTPSIDGNDLVVRVSCDDGHGHPLVLARVWYTWDATDGYVVDENTYGMAPASVIDACDTVASRGENARVTTVDA